MRNDPAFSGIPLEVITKGRDLENVLTAYMTIYENARKAVTTPGKSEAEVFADAMQGAVYRLYLLGVEDGMRRE